MSARPCMWRSERGAPPCPADALEGDLFCAEHRAELPDQSEWLREVAQWRDEFR